MHMPRRITRREFIARTAQASVAVGAVGSLLSSCSSSDGSGSAPDAQSNGDQPATLPAFAFTETQRRALSAAVARLVPASGPGDWSAADAGAVEYIEQLLNGFSEAGNPKIYGGGPSRQHFSEFQPLSRVKIAGWQAEILRLRELYSAGLDELNRLARGPLALLPGEFAAIQPLVQDAILTSLDLQGTAFFAALYAHTMEGVYSHPVYGGNRDYIGWNSVCYQGDVHGVRFPNGYDPSAHDQPWNKFGGYSPEEMIQPGACGGGAPSTTAAMSDDDLLNSLLLRFNDRAKLL
jgi:gluconate 2-dehydrogenase gamma chain